MDNEIKNKYILGDCFNWLKKIEDKSVDLVFTSVPDLNEIDIESEKTYNDFLFKALDEILRVVKDDGFFVACQTDRKFNSKILPKHIVMANRVLQRGYIIKDYKILIKDRVDKVNLYRLNFSHVLIFTKTGKIPLEKKKGDFLIDTWVFKLPKNKNYWGSDFTDLVIKTLSKEGDFVVDPFAGRGTVLKSCKELNRNYFGTEINPDVYEIDYV